jgi:hypothetical protein
VQIKVKLHPRAWFDALLTYPRFLGTIKPELMKGAVGELAPRLAIHHGSWWPKQLVGTSKNSDLREFVRV